MAEWLGRLLGRSRNESSAAVQEIAVAPTAPEGSGETAAPPRFSVWDQLSDDPGAQALRAQWEARWDEF